MTCHNVKLVMPASHHADDDILTGDGNLTITREFIPDENDNDVECLAFSFHLSGKEEQFERSFIIDGNYCIQQLKNFLELKIEK